VGRFPQLQAFINSDHASGWPGLKISYVRGADPTIKLVNANGDVEETLNIEKWNTETIVEFLNEHLEK